jgi:hypothetical protein
MHGQVPDRSGLIASADLSRPLDALFVNAPLRDYSVRPRVNDFTLPVLGMAYIATCAARAGYNVGVLDAEACGLGIADATRLVNDLPDLAVMLTASPGVISARLDQRGRHDRFEHDPAPAGTEAAMYRAAAATLAGLGVPVTQLDTSQLTPMQTTDQIAGAMRLHCASLSEHG